MKLLYILLILAVLFLLMRQSSPFYGPKQAGEMCDSGDECYHNCAGGRCN
jgi:hypothetical protein